MQADKWNERLTLIANLGVVIGLMLLIWEINQNTEMMRAQMHSDSMSLRVQHRFDVSNSGEYARIFAKINDVTGSYFWVLDEETMALLTSEEQYRIRSWLIGMRDHLADLFYQCQEGFLDDEFCDYRLRSQVVGMLELWPGAKVRIIAQRPSFLAEIQRVAREEGLPIPDDQGNWE